METVAEPDGPSTLLLKAAVNHPAPDRLEVVGLANQLLNGPLKTPVVELKLNPDFAAK